MYVAQLVERGGGGRLNGGREEKEAVGGGNTLNLLLVYWCVTTLPSLAIQQYVFHTYQSLR